MPVMVLSCASALSRRRAISTTSMISAYSQAPSARVSRRAPGDRLRIELTIASIVFLQLFCVVALAVAEAAAHAFAGHAGAAFFTQPQQAGDAGFDFAPAQARQHLGRHGHKGLAAALAG